MNGTNDRRNEMLLYNSIARRYSVRKYEKRAVEKEKSDQVMNYVPETLADVEVKAIPVDGEIMRRYLETMGGKVFNAPMYFVLAARERPHFLIEAGYRGEQVILKATSLGLGTCWIGAFFAEKKIRALLKLEPSWRMVAVSPLGYESTGVVDSAVGGLIRRAAGFYKRKPIPEIFFAEKYGHPPSIPGKYSGWEKIFQAVRVAPSWANLQPWRFVVREDAVYAVLVPPLAEKRGLKPAQIKSGMDYSLVDMGIAMSHFYIACRAEERRGSWALFGNDQPEMKANLEIPGENRLVAVWK
ncbi:MAG: nitroreductase family protein [bacterium]|nr:nitroreductase family protein [bacterium]